MNIFKVIGWTDDPDEKYPSIDGSVAVDRAIMTEVREKGYRFGGDAHQERRGCCPVFNNGAKVCCSMRGWGAIMAEALKRYCPNFHGYGGGMKDEANIERYFGGLLPQREAAFFLLFLIYSSFRRAFFIFISPKKGREGK